jgi:Tfp pilus assembly protein PilV
VNPARPTPESVRADRGFAYVEVLVATMLVALCLLPAIQSLQTAILGASVNETHTTSAYALEAKLADILAQPFGDLDAAATAAGSPATPTSYSAPPLEVYLARYDGDDADADADPFTGGDPGLLWVRIVDPSTGQSVQTLKNR